MLDENFIVSVFTFVMNVCCKIGLHGWEKITPSKDGVASSIEIWDQAICIDFYRCWNCGSEEMVYEDYWGVKHTVKLKSGGSHRK